MTALLALLFGIPVVHAAADPTLINAVGGITNSATENVTGIVASSTVMSGVGLFLAITLGIGLLFWLLKKGIRGR